MRLYLSPREEYMLRIFFFIRVHSHLTFALKSTTNREDFAMELLWILYRQ